jgi:hypothetical protein
MEDHAFSSILPRAVRFRLLHPAVGLSHLLLEDTFRLFFRTVDDNLWWYTITLEEQ